EDEHRSLLNPRCLYFAHRRWCSHDRCLQNGSISAKYDRCGSCQHGKNNYGGHVSADFYQRERRRRTHGDNRLFSRLSPKQTTRINLMKVSFIQNERGNVLLCAVCTIFILSLIAANVLLNCTARYNQASNHVRSWNEALYAAESGADMAYNEDRKIASNPTNTIRATNGWTTSGTAYTSGTTTFSPN